MEVTITNENFDELLKGDKPLLVDFWATWCAPCRALAPTVEKVAEEYADKVVVAKCNVEEADQVAERFNIMNIPTLLFFKGGEVVNKLVGNCDKATITKRLDEML